MIKRYKPFNFEEARRNPEMNPHIGAWDYVDKYKDDKDVYISFTEIDKIGINPRSKYNTPVGIYTYPLKGFVEKYIGYPDEGTYKDSFSKSTLGSFAPFAGNAKYINFIKVKDKTHFINDMYKDYGSNNYDRDIKILEKIYKDQLASDRYEITDLYSFFKKSKKDSFTIFYFDETTQDGEITIGRVSDVDRKGVSIDGEFIEYHNIYSIKRYNKLIWENPEYKDYTGDDGVSFDDIIQKGQMTAKEKNPIMSMWNITRLLAEKLSNNTKQASTKWNLILSKDLGYSGFADKSGKGYIHPSEPMQAVFFNTRAFEVITRVENVPAKNLLKGKPPKLFIGMRFKNNQKMMAYQIIDMDKKSITYYNIRDKSDQYNTPMEIVFNRFSNGEWVIVE